MACQDASTMAIGKVILWPVIYFHRVSGESKGHSTIVDDSPQARTIFHRADNDSNLQLTHAELHSVFLLFDTNGKYIFQISDMLPGPGCSKLTTSLLNVSFKFLTVTSQISQYFCQKN